MMKDMDIEKIFVVCVTVLLLSCLGSCTVSNFDKREKWAEAVKNGADPLVVTCALGGADSRADDVICYAVANKR